ncbi:uncharacterized protein LOC142337408 isoform X2 [Convolutriloba macropyga]|uniref:uncharacterized protein LOC142337408 isoform X2 n=1 Tax=Convolutriloba macropyga TaxID=536237 RepID=UPI003F51B0F9
MPIIIMQLVVIIIGTLANSAVIYATLTRFSCRKASNLFVCTLATIDVFTLLFDLSSVIMHLSDDQQNMPTESYNHTSVFQNCENRTNFTNSFSSLVISTTPLSVQDQTTANIPCLGGAEGISGDGGDMEGCDVMASLGNTLFLASAHNLVLIAFDRYIFIERPFAYCKIVERFTLLWVTLFLILPSATFVALFHLCFCFDVVTPNIYMLVVLVAFFLCFMATVLMYSSIFATARRHHKKMATAMHQASSAARNSTRRRMKSSGSVTSCKTPVDKNQVRSKEEASNIDGMEAAANGNCNVKQDLQKGFMVRFDSAQRRIVVGYVVIVGVFFFSLLLVTLSAFLEESDWPRNTVITLKRLAGLLFTANSASNPFIYYFTNREYRDGFCSMIGCDKTTADQPKALQVDVDDTCGTQWSTRGRLRRMLMTTSGGLSGLISNASGRASASFTWRRESSRKKERNAEKGEAQAAEVSELCPALQVDVDDTCGTQWSTRGRLRRMLMTTSGGLSGLISNASGRASASFTWRRESSRKKERNAEKGEAQAAEVSELCPGDDKQMPGRKATVTLHIPPNDLSNGHTLTSNQLSVPNVSTETFIDGQNLGSNNDVTQNKQSEPETIKTKEMKDQKRASISVQLVADHSSYVSQNCDSKNCGEDENNSQIV